MFTVRDLKFYCNFKAMWQAKLHWNFILKLQDSYRKVMT